MVGFELTSRRHPASRHYRHHDDGPFPNITSMKAPSLHKVTESSSPHPNPPGHSLLEKLSPGRSTQCDLAESPPQPPASVASRNQSREDQPRMAVVASRPLDSCSAHAWSIPSRWSDGWTTNHPFSPVDPPCAPVVPLYRTHPHPHLPYHSSILNPTHMQPENVYRPVFVTGAERGALDATGKVAPTAHTAPHTPASQSLPLDLPRLHVNVAPNQPQQQQPQQQLASQGAASFPQQGVMFPEIAVFGQLDQSVPRMALLHPLHMQQHGAPGAVSAGERRVGAKSRSQSDYASRHLAAEQGRRTRINERYVGRGGEGCGKPKLDHVPDHVSYPTTWEGEPSGS